MKRGDIRILRGPTGASTKARPCVIVQRASSLDGAKKLTVCPLTSDLAPGNRVRPLVLPTEQNGLRTLSQVEVDWVLTEHIRYFGPVIGSIEADVLQAVDVALRRWLAL